MERLLLFIKHRIAPLWKIIDRINGQIYSILYSKREHIILNKVLEEGKDENHVYRRLVNDDILKLHRMIINQPMEDLKYFHPHGFSEKELCRHLRNRSFLMMGVFNDDMIIGYFFLRFFANKRCFVGRLIDRDHRGRGIGSEMNRIMYETAWQMGFHCLSTISRNNTAVIRAHAKNPNIKILKELDNDYMLIEFIKKPDSAKLNSTGFSSKNKT